MKIPPPPLGGANPKARARPSPTRRTRDRVFCIATVALFFLTVLACVVQDGPPLQWTGPIVPRAINALFFSGAAVDPYFENFLVVELDDRTDLIFDSDPEFNRRVLRLYDLGLPAPVGTIGSFYAARGVWFSSVVTTGWSIRDRDSLLLTDEDRKRVHAASVFAGDPPRRIWVRGWIVFDVLGVAMLGVWLWLLPGAVLAALARWRRHGPGQCAACGYLLEGLGDRACPECGTPPGGGSS